MDSEYLDKDKFRSVLVNRLIRAEEQYHNASEDDYHRAEYYEGKAKAYKELLEVVDDWQQHPTRRKR